MRYLTAIGIGILTANVAAIAWVLIRFVLPVVAPFVTSRARLDGSGSGSAGAIIGPGSIILVAMLGFLGGFVWTLWTR